MLNYVIRRLFWLILTIVGITVITFVITSVAPVDPVRLIVGPHADRATIEAAFKVYGFDKPIWYRYWLFFSQFVHGNLGYSFISHQTVDSELASAIPITASIAVPAVLAELLIGIPVGLVMATRPGSVIDGILSSLALVFYSLPAFWVGSIMMFVFAFLLGWFPLSGWSPGSIVLPALSIGMVGAAQYARILRTSMLEVHVLDYVRTARAKGLSERVVLMRHVFRNALIPFVTLAGLDLGSQLGGLIVTEVVFGLPGLGVLLDTGVQNFDEPTIMGVTVIAAVAIVVMNLLVDLSYAVLDPRISYA